MYYRQLSAGIIRKKDKIKTIFVSPEVPKDKANKTGIDIMIFILIFMENCLYYDAIHDFSVGWEPVLIKRIIIDLEAILENLKITPVF